MKKQLFTILIIISFAVSQAQSLSGPGWERLRQRPYPQWFRDAKLGIFIHWGVYSVPSWSGKEQYGEWFLRGLLTGDTARIRFQETVFGKDFRYEDYAPLFKAELFDAREWAELFKEAGARYVVLVSKHHDGYCLWPSKFAPGWNTVDVGPQRDIVGELSKAVRVSGLKMGLYYSLPEWNNKLYRWGKDKPELVHSYVEKHMIPQLKEVVGTYKPSLLFADGEWDHPASTWHSAELISWYYDLIGDDAVVNDRWGSGSDGVGFRTPEYSSGLSDSDRPWAEVRGLGRSFGLNRNESLDAYMTPGDLVHFFVRAVANGGGMILNVGPYCDGQIPLLQQERIKQLGSWLKVNGEAIYGATMCDHPEEKKEVILERTDQMIDFDWVRNSPGKPVAEDDFTAEWTGFLEPRYSETYLFEALADDGIRVWIDGKLILAQGNFKSDTETNSNLTNTEINLKVGNKYPIRVEYQESKQNANASIWWSSKSQLKEIVPTVCLTTALDEGTPGLNAIYRSQRTWLCYTVNHDNRYAVMLQWPEDNRLILKNFPPDEIKRVSLLGREGELPWNYRNGHLEIDLSVVKISELPCEWAWVVKVEP